MKIALLDTETTGAAFADEVIELAFAVIEVDPEDGCFQRLCGHYSGLREPRVAISPGAFAVHGITHAQVRGHSLDEVRCRELLGASDCVIAHNVSFDRGMLGRLWSWSASLDWRCSCWHFDWRTIGAPNRRLQSLLAHFRIAPGTAHRAGSDVKGLHALLQHRHPIGGRTYLWHVLNARQGQSARRQSSASASALVPVATTLAPDET